MSQPAGGLAALLTGAPKESFASLLDGDETVQPELENPALLARKQGDGERRAPQDRRHEHPRNTRSADRRGDSAGVARPQANATVVESPSRLRSETPHWDSKPDAQSSGVSVGQSKAVVASSIEGRAMSTRTESDTEAFPSDDAKGTDTTVSPVKVDPTEEAMHRSVEASGTKIPELISSPRASDWSAGDGISAGPEGGGSASGAQDLGVAFRSDDAVAGVVASRPGARFVTGQVVRGIGGMTPAQFMNQNDLIPGGSGQHEADAMPANPQSVDVGAIGVGTVGQPDAHSAQVRHDTSGQMLKAVQAAGAPPRTTDGAAAELVRARQTAIQRRSVPVDGTSSKPSAAADPSSREAVMQHAADANTSRMLANAMRGELHVGLHTEAFGRVTIQTNTALGQFSAQVSLEDSKQSAALAAHFPGVEQRILQQHGLDASVRIVGESNTAPGGSPTGNSRHGSGANDGTRGERRSGRAFEQSIGGRSRVTVGEIARERPGRHAALGRLDVTV